MTKFVVGWYFSDRLLGDEQQWERRKTPGDNHDPPAVLRGPKSGGGGGCIEAPAGARQACHRRELIEWHRDMSRVQTAPLGIAVPGNGQGPGLGAVGVRRHRHSPENAAAPAHTFHFHHGVARSTKRGGRSGSGTRP